MNRRSMLGFLATLPFVGSVGWRRLSPHPPFWRNGWIRSIKATPKPALNEVAWDFSTDNLVVKRYERHEAWTGVGDAWGSEGM
jgi:hypothetical protein